MGVDYHGSEFNEFNFPAVLAYSGLEKEDGSGRIEFDKQRNEG
jgi:hypothetical protein